MLLSPLEILSEFQRRRQGGILGGWPRRGSGGEAPPPHDARKGCKFPKKIQFQFSISKRKLPKMDYFRRLKKSKKTLRKFSGFRRKTQLFGEFLRKFSNIPFENRNKFSSLINFQKNSKPFAKFSRFVRKTIG